MSNSKYISQFMLECYNRGKVSEKERIIIEKELAENNELLARYEEIKKSDEELRIRFPLEKFPKLYAIKDDIVANFEHSNSAQKVYRFAGRRKMKLIIGICAAAVLCAIFSVFIYFNTRASNDQIMIAENNIETTEEVVEIADNVQEVSYIELSEPSIKNETKPELRTEPETQTYIAADPMPDTGIRTRGAELVEPQSDSVIITDEMSNINIPPGMSFIFDNMFADKDLSFVVIPSRIKTIGKNAFGGNPLLSVTIGAGVSIEDNAIPGNFAVAYNSYGKTGGTYTRADVNSDIWEKE